MPPTDLEEEREFLASLLDRLWPICRSITGPGIRQSLDLVGESVALKRHRFPSGARVFDWTVPPEWSIREAYFIGPDGQRRADFARNNLHVVGYSAPFRGVLGRAELLEHVHTLPEHPDAIPYVTSYYSPRWGFCLTHRELEELPEGDYEVVIDSELKPGRVEIGEAVLEGQTDRQVLFSSYLCHPSLANNELSGPLVLAALYRRVAALPERRFTYRFVFSAETIGTIAYLSVAGDELKEKLVAGYQVTCVGDPGDFTYKTSRQGDALPDRVARVVLRDAGAVHREVPFDPSNGSDERQYCSPGFNLPVGSLMRSMYASYPQYHTSKDDRDYITHQALQESVDMYFGLVLALEQNHTWFNVVQHCEPQLGPRGLYPSLTSNQALGETMGAMMWLLNLADGTHDLVAIAERSGRKLALLAELAGRLSEAGLLQKRESGP